MKMKAYKSREYLLDELKKKNYIQISKENNVDTSTIQRYMRRHGLTKKRVSWTEEELHLLKENYEKNPYVYQLFPNRSVSSINHKASRLGFGKIIRKSIYSVNHDFFKQFSPEMAYVLGWFFSDGNVSSDKGSISIHLNKKDHYILEKMKNLMESTRPIDSYSNSSYLRLDSKILAQDLINLRCVPKKSLFLEFPDIPPQYLSHFIRGFFDGDGSIHFNKPNTIKVTFISTKQFLEKLQIELNNILGLRIGSLQRQIKMCIALYYGDDARKLCDWMYENSKDLYLIRKKERFDKHIELRKNGKL